MDYDELEPIDPYLRISSYSVEAAKLRSDAKLLLEDFESGCERDALDMVREAEEGEMNK